MRAVSLNEYKEHNEQDFTPVELKMPECGPGMVLIKTKAASINPVDWKVVGGHITSWPNPVPFTPGYDLSGIVEAIGEGVDSFKVGDAVFACNWGSNKDNPQSSHADEGQPIGGAFAEYCILPASKVSRKPEGITHEEAAAISLVGQTALQSVERLLGKFGTDYTGKRILVLGGAGAVGYIACQVAKIGGATVYTTCSPRTQDYVKGTGADHLINYREVDWSTAEMLKDVDAVLDTTGEDKSFEKAKAVLKEDGSFASIANFDVGFDPTAHPPLKFASFVTLRNDPEDQDKLASMVASKKLKVSVEKKFPFTKQGISEAFATQASGKSMGKNVIVFD